MAVEIERKFLVTGEGWRERAGPGRRFCQGHVATADHASVRIRRTDNKAFVTIKGKRNGIARPEFEYEIPTADAEEMLKTLCKRPLLEKTRYCVEHAGLVWEVDVFVGRNEGLILAEVELDHPDQPVSIPDWVGREVTDDPRYRNATIATAGVPSPLIG